MCTVSGEVKIPRYAIGKVRISAVTMDDALRMIEEQVRKGQADYVCVANLRTTILSQKESPFCRIQNDSFITVPDGMPLVWFARLAGVKNVKRVTGPDLMMRVLELSVEKGYSHYFLGDTENTLTEMTQIISNRYPEIEIKGIFSPPFRLLTDREYETIATEINRLKATFVWLALRAPKQERFMVKLLPLLEKSILIGVGAAFRFLTGEYRHPSRIIQMFGLEGLCWRFGKKRLAELIWWYCYSFSVFCVLIVRMYANRFKRVCNDLRWNPKEDSNNHQNK